MIPDVHVANNKDVNRRTDRPEHVAYHTGYPNMSVPHMYKVGLARRCDFSSASPLSLNSLRLTSLLHLKASTIIDIDLDCSNLRALIKRSSVASGSSEASTSSISNCALRGIFQSDYSDSVSQRYICSP